MLEAKSVGGTVLFDGRNVTIRHESSIARSVFGNAEHVLPIGHIGSVEWKSARWFRPGHIRFAVAGSQAGAWPTPVNRDENAVLFSSKEQAAFEELRAAVQDALSP